MKAEREITSSVPKLPGPVTKPAVQPSLSVRDILEHWVRAPTTPQRVVLRSRIILLSLDGVPRQRIAYQLGISQSTIDRWTRRFAESGSEGLLHDAPGRGRHPSMMPATMRDRLRQANLLGPDNQPVSMRRAAEFLGLSATSVWRALHKPPLSRGRRSRKSLADAG